ncbi:MAG: crossover junction endodeoxyribonuclease RuvC [Ruminococcus sp.]|nr:crossover junction endodeoxyribonuclease RuvC [Ruminococcus sp.]
MRVLGIDPGYAIIGYGVVECESGHFSLTTCGRITTDAGTPFDRRLKIIFDDMCEIIRRFKPEQLSVEKLFFNSNQKTAIDVAQARGVTLLPAIQAGVPIFEYTPLQVKSSIVGYGRAEKHQVQEMVKNMLHLQDIIKPDDTADAVALAITHGLSLGRRQLERKNDLRQ